MHNLLERDALVISFDVFQFHEIAPKDDLHYLMHYLFEKQDLFDSLDISQQVFMKFVQKIGQG